MNNALKNRLSRACPLMAGLIEYLEAKEAKSVAVEADVEKTVTFPSERQLVHAWFVDSDGVEAGFDVYDITTTGFKCKAGSAGTVHYITDEVTS